MRLLFAIATIAAAGLAFAAFAAPPSALPKGGKDSEPKQVEVTADQSLEWYQDKRLYVARGNAKAVRGALTITADILTAHEREKPQGAAKQPKPAANDKSGAGDIDLMTAEGHVVIVDPRQRITGEHAVYDLGEHKMIVTGDNLRYETAKEVVTATDSLEYYEDAKLAVARGHAVADQPDRHVEGDVLTAEFRDAPNGQSQLTKMTAQGHVTVLTKNKSAKDSDAKDGKSGSGKSKGGDVSRGDHAVYDAGSNMAILTGSVRITRGDGTQLSGDVGEVDFNNDQSRLMSDGAGRVRALLPQKTTDRASDKNATPQPASDQPAATP
jgi:lipopolysaccharide export system protein LptA